MPHSELHKKKLKKNLAILAAIVIWCVVIFLVSMIRMANASEITPGVTARDSVDVFYQQRAIHNHQMKMQRNIWNDRYEERQPRRDRAAQSRDDQREEHSGQIKQAQQNWQDEYDRAEAERQARQQTMNEGRARHNRTTGARPAQWWNERTAGGR